MYSLQKFIFIIFIGILICNKANSQRSTVIDLDGNKYGNYIVKIISHGDSLYVLSQYGGPYDKGIFYRISPNGEGYHLIKTFDNENFYPYDMIGNDSIIYGTIRFNESYHCKIFTYKYGNGKFNYIKEFSSYEAMDVRLKYITDSVIWGLSNRSFEDEGCVFTIKPDGTGFKKIYNNTGEESGQNPIDMCIVNNEIFIACYNGGGIQYYSEGYISSGSVIKVDITGRNYQMIFRCQDQKGTNPHSIIYNNGRLYVLFDFAGLDGNAKLLSINPDGSYYEQLANLKSSGRGDLIKVGDILYGTTFGSLFSYNLEDQSYSSLTTFPYPSGVPITGPAYHNHELFFGTRNDAAGGNEALEKYTLNMPPTVTESIPNQMLQQGENTLTIDLLDSFKDQNGDILTYSVSNFNTSKVDAKVVGNKLLISGKDPGSTTLTITANDDKGGTVSQTFTLTVNGKPAILHPISDKVRLAGFIALNVDLSNTFEDPDKDPFLLSVQSSDTAVVNTLLTGGILTIKETGRGKATITITATDERGGVNNEEFTIEVQNNNPQIVKTIDNQLVQQGFTTLSIDLSTYFTDPDRDLLTFKVTAFVKNIVSAAINGNNLVVNEQGPGTSTVTIIAEDGKGGTVSQTFTLTVNAKPVILNPMADISKFAGFNNFNIDLSQVFYDPEEDPILLKAQSSDTTIVKTGIAEQLLTIKETGRGKAVITITATDKRGGVNTENFVVEIKSNLKIIKTIDDQLVQQGFKSISIDLSSYFMDPDFSLLTYKASGYDENLIIAEVSGNMLNLTEKGTGSTMIEVTAQNTIKDTISQTFMFTVNSNPVIINKVADLTLEYGFKNLTLDISDVFMDPNGDALLISAESSNPLAVKVNLFNNKLSIAENGKGTSTVTLTAMDGKEGLAMDDFIITVKQPTSAMDYKEESVLIYPNPASQFIKISQKTNKSFESFEIYSPEGILVMADNLKTQQEEVNLEHLTPGIYLLRLNGITTMVKKIIIR